MKSSEERLETRYIRELKRQIEKLKRENSQLRKKNNRLENTDEYDAYDDYEEPPKPRTKYQDENAIYCESCNSDMVDIFNAGLYSFFKCQACGNKGKIKQKNISEKVV